MLELYEPQQSHLVRFQYDQRLTAQAILARNLWLQGYADQALALVPQMVAEAEGAPRWANWAAERHQPWWIRWLAHIALVLAAVGVGVGILSAAEVKAVWVIAFSNRKSGTSEYDAWVTRCSLLSDADCRVLSNI